ncbi:hypothetical protein LX36DRAFT_659354 [Colletotrichum falcatum]|nr:hypothetical protein LX36DRAFT_659354 [Colletotrichum falcatum]
MRIPHLCLGSSSGSGCGQKACVSRRDGQLKEICRNFDIFFIYTPRGGGVFCCFALASPTLFVALEWVGWEVWHRTVTGWGSQKTRPMLRESFRAAILILLTRLCCQPAAINITTSLSPSPRRGLAVCLPQARSSLVLGGWVAPPPLHSAIDSAKPSGGELKAVEALEMLACIRVLADRPFPGLFPSNPSPRATVPHLCRAPSTANVTATIARAAAPGMSAKGLVVGRCCLSSIFQRVTNHSLDLPQPDSWGS